MAGAGPPPSSPGLENPETDTPQAGTARSRWTLGVLRRAQLLRARWSLLLACAVLAIGAFVKLTSELNEGELDSFDRTLLDHVVALRVPGLNGPAVDLTALGSATVLSIWCVFGFGLLMVLHDRLSAWQLVMAAIGGSMLSSLFKNALTRARPSHVQKLVEVTSYSYPSGHSLAAASVYLTLAILASRHLSARRAHILVFGVALLLMCGIGLSRAYLGVHYPSDIAAGLLLGSGWSLLISALFSYLRARQL